MKALFAALALVAASGMTAAKGAVLARYSFDNDFTDSSGNGRDATLTDVGTPGNSAITTTAGDFVFGGGAMNFSADRDYLALPSHTFGTGSAYTVAFWARKAPGDTAGAAQWDMVLGQRDNTNFFIALNDATGTGNRLGIRWRSNTSAGGIREANYNSPNDTSWHHYAITADSSKNLSFYLDGVFQQTIPNVETGFIIDTIGDAYTTASDFDFHGQLDEVWILTEVLDATAVSNLKTFNSLVPEPSVLPLLAAGAWLLFPRRRAASPGA